jgi:hypothetical protein
LNTSGSKARRAVIYPITIAPPITVPEEALRIIKKFGK